MPMPWLSSKQAHHCHSRPQARTLGFGEEVQEGFEDSGRDVFTFRKAGSLHPKSPRLKDFASIDYPASTPSP